MALTNWQYNSLDLMDPIWGFSEEQKNPTQGAISESSTHTRYFFVNWSRLPAFLDDLLGYSYLTGPSSGVYAVNRELPDAHPLFKNFWVSEASYQAFAPPGFDAGLKFGEWPYAKVTAVYRPAEYAILADDDVADESQRFVSHKYSFDASMLIIQSSMRFVGTGIGPGRLFTGSPGKLSLVVMHTMTWHDVPGKLSDPFEVPTVAAIKKCTGKVNDASYFGNPAGTMLFLGAEATMKTPKLTPFVDSPWYSWEITYKFAERNNGINKYGEQTTHNHFYDVNLPGWDLVTHDGLATGNKVYESADLSQLFVIT